MDKEQKLSWVEAQMRRASNQKKFCVKCDKEKLISQFPMRTYKEKLYINSVCSACVGRTNRAKIKLRLFDAFGYQCNCCGERNPQFLTLQHIQAGTNPYGRKRVNGKYVTTRIQSQVVNDAIRSGDKTKYEVLCLNCNWAHGHYGECPHRLNLSAEDVLAQIRRDASGVGTKYRRTRDTAKRVDEVLKAIEKASA